MTGDISREELNSVLAILDHQYGYDFTGYAPASLKRRVQHFMRNAGIANVFDLRHHLVNDNSFFSWFIQSVTVNVTEMFRDPDFYRAMRESVLPKLASYPIIKIWHAGCSTGEEVFSMAIMLQEQGLLGRCKIYATDINPVNLKKAESGMLSFKNLKEYTQNYQKAGGKKDFATYYTAKYDNAIINKELRENIVFSQHNLVTDSVFNEFNLICCRNVLIYFNKELQTRVMKLFHDSMVPLGYLALGIKESLLFTGYANTFEPITQQHKIYRRKL